MRAGRKDISFLDFLRDIGKHFSVNQMVGKESVRARMEDREVGISYTEFSYMLLQAFDFMVLAREQNCELQIGGSDQWGNITAGIELTRKKLGKQVFGLTLPLITNADGTKFGKTEAGAIWLDPKRTSVYKFYQFWINTDDRDVIRYLKFFTFLANGRNRVCLEKQHAENPGARSAHKMLAKAVTDLIHGEEASDRSDTCQRDSCLAAILEDISEEARSTNSSAKCRRRKLRNPNWTARVFRSWNFWFMPAYAQSKGQARKDIEGGGMYINNIREANIARVCHDK